MGLLGHFIIYVAIEAPVLLLKKEVFVKALWFVPFMGGVLI
jgi:hypothetical protein